MSSKTATQAGTPDRVRIAQLEAVIVGLENRATLAEVALASLRRAYTHALEQLELQRHRLYVAKAERVPSSAEQLAFDALLGKVQELEKALNTEGAAVPPPSGDQPAPPKPPKKNKPSGRRDLAASDLRVVRVEIVDPEFDGKVKPIGFAETSRLGWERGGPVCIVTARAVYGVPVVSADPNAPAEETDRDETVVMTDAACEATLDVRFVKAPRPKELVRRSFLAPSMIAHVLASKYLMGVPFYRLEQALALQGVSLDRGTMCRYAEHVGATLGSIVLAMRDEAFATAFCLSTDATGVSVQPGPLKDHVRRPCIKGHFFVVLADCDHVFFEYQEKHNGAVVSEMFKGFSGYIQADAHGVYGALFRGDTPKGAKPDPERGPPPIEVGCWSHCRRYFWEAAVCKHPLGLQGMRLTDAIFAADALLADMAPAQRKALRDRYVRPLVDDFFAWIALQRVAVRERGLVASALGYSHNQEQALRRFLDNGRLRMENNRSERALRAIATARKAWLFFGSDDHACAAANLFSLVASCKLHRLDPERYIAEVVHVMPYWPRERYLELSPRYWAGTRARLDPAELARQVGPVTVPAPRTAEEQTPAS